MAAGRARGRPWAALAALLCALASTAHCTLEMTASVKLETFQTFEPSAAEVHLVRLHPS
jgi:hypothetical protein